MIEDLEEYDNQRDYSGLQAIEESLVGQKLDENQVQSKGVLNEEVSEGLEDLSLGRPAAALFPLSSRAEAGAVMTAAVRSLVHLVLCVV